MERMDLEAGDPVDIADATWEQRPLIRVVFLRFLLVEVSIDYRIWLRGVIRRAALVRK